MAAARKALARQHRGGMANLAGNTFESFFAIWRVLAALERLLRGHESKLAFQLKNCHVDDWVEDLKTERHFFQLKRKKSVSWGSVRSEFVSQLATGVKGKRVKVSLVVHTELQVTKLRAAKGAVAGAEVLYFPGSLYPQDIIASKPANLAVRAVCVESSPTRSDLEAIWSSIDFAWQKVRKPGKFVDVEAVLDALSDQNFPPLRHPWQPTQVWKRAEKLLKRVGGLSFEINGGHFSYSDGAGTEGRVSCRTPTFRTFALRVLTHRPKNLDAVWDLL